MALSREPGAFEPIAVVGQACVLPGALSPAALWQAVREGRDLISRVPDGHWRVDPALVLAEGGGDEVDDRTWTDRGGYVRGFEERFDPAGFRLPADEILALDPLVQWLLCCGREALGRLSPARCGAIVGNLSYPSSALSRLAESVWFDEVLGAAFLDGRARELAGIERPAPVNRFMSGLPVQLAARALGLDGPAFALDSACSSSLYAIKLACDALHDRRADLMLAGGVNRADDLFIHIGFCALQAMSRSGQSRPFHRAADGLVPAEGAALVALRRLDDAVRGGDTILGVIRAVGLSNDGRGRGLLAPCPLGQERAMRRAYRQAGLEPADVALLECHATGTPVGDGVEVTSVARVFQGVERLPVGSLKSNMGHPITASGAAGLIKVMAAMDEGTLPPSIHAEEPLDELADTPLEVIRQARPWSGPRRAGINNFGFGGNNAHLIVEQWSGQGAPSRRPAPSPSPQQPLAIVGLQVIAADADQRATFARQLFAGERRVVAGESLPFEGGWASEVELPLTGLRFPPRDLDETLAQQLSVLRAALLAVQEHGELPAERTGVLIGMQCDADVARYGARLRMPQWARDWSGGLGLELGPDWLAGARQGVGFLRKAAGVVGAMPNIPANRLNGQFDFSGPSFTVSAEECSGLVCLELAARALRSGELDAALVGAVDLCCEPVHRAAARDLLAHEGPGQGREVPGDAAVVLLLRRLEDARRDGDRVYAVLQEDAGDGVALRLGLDDDPRLLSLTPRYGHAHAASGLLHVAAAALACHHRASPGQVGQPPAPWWPGEDRAEVRVKALGGAAARVVLQGDSRAAPLVLGPLPRVHRFAGADRSQLLELLARGEERPAGPARLAILAADAEQLARRREQARALLTEASPAPDSDALARQGIYFHERPVGGELAFVFTGPAGVYPGMGRELLLGLPELLEQLHERCRSVEQTGRWVYAPDQDEASIGPHEKLWGSSYLSQLHAELSRGLLGLAPQAAIGFCSGETNALFALGAWSDLDTFYPELLDAGVFSRQIGGELHVVREAWGLARDDAAAWVNWRVLADEQQVLEAVDGEPRCHLTIISAPGDVVIGGEPAACQRVVERVGRSRAYPLGYDVAIHCPEMETYAGPWRRLHHRQTREVPGVRFYSVASGQSYRASADAAADALTGMALCRVDFPRLIRQAHDDGVRVFLEHGPRDGCTKWIQRILGDRPHLAVPLDRGGRSSLEQALHAAAQLWCAGLEPDLDGVQRRLARVDRPVELGGPTRRYPAHPAPLALPPLPDGQPAEVMAPAPALPPVLAAAGPATSTTPAAPARPATGQVAVALAHQRFLEDQASVHRAFLELRQRSLARLTGLVQSGAVPAVELTAPPPPPVGLAPAPPAVEAQPAATLPPVWNPSGPRFDRPQLEVLASGRVSDVLGPLFRQQDGHARQVRLPEPPLLLVDRVVGIAGEPGSMGKGTIWTETDVTEGAWYLHDGRMPSGIVVESGQSDLLLISWLGIDFLNQGQRVYRLLGCELTNHGSLPRVGETLRYQIHVDGHARAGDVRLFFFHYDCYVGDELRLRVRNAQAGFFTDEELTDSGGVLWDAETAEHLPDVRVDPPAVRCTRSSFSAGQVRAFSEGRAHECFGPGFERTLTHTQTPRIQGGKMLLLEEVARFDPQGGPWGRGYLRVENAIHPDDWFMQGHFKNDPCMPGTLMCEGCLQAMAFYLTAMGYTVNRDGWRFEPVPDETYKLQCRGQVTPASKRLTYEVFVEEIIDGPQPTIFADILGTSDGLKIFHGRRMGLRLVPDWPMETMDLSTLIPARELERPVATGEGGFRFDYRSLLACAWGRPSQAFGPMAEIFDGTRHIARLPGPPYHFMTRVTHIEGEMGSLQTGASIELEYDIPPDAWYFQENGAPLMPYAVLLEAVLQPCGWLAVYIGCPGSSPKDLYFRNLDGSGTVHTALPPAAGTLRTRTTLKSISKMGDIILVSFDVECRVGQTLVYSLETGFGFFPAEALASQVGLPVSDEQRAQLAAPSDFSVDLRRREEHPRYFAGQPRLPGPMLLMLDRVSGYWPGAGKAGLGRLRGEKDVEPGEWFFKAHFFQDPVQPGSLGLEAMLQLLQLYMLHEGLGRDIPDARFEPIALERPFTWKYRGQVTPEKQRVTVELEILERGRDERGAYAVAESSLWVDGLRIYHSPNLGMRIVPGPGAATGQAEEQPGEELLDPAVDRWLHDHRPNWTLPTLPLMSMVDRLAAAASHQQPGLQVVEVRDCSLSGWLALDEPRRLRSTAELQERGDDSAVVRARLATWREAARQELSRWEPVAEATVVLAADYSPQPAALPRLTDAERAPDPYAAGALFHGPAFQLLTRLEVGAHGSSALLDAGAGQVPFGLLNQALLDAAVHGILHDELERWSAEVPPKHIAYPYRLKRLSLHGPPPRDGAVRCETRLAGFDGGERFPRFHIQLSLGERVWAELELVEILIPMGPHADDRQKRIDFRDGRFVPGAGLSRFAGDETRLTDAEVRARDWLRGSVAHAYRAAWRDDPAALTRELAVKDHVSQRARVHPAAVEVRFESDEEASAVLAAQPLTRYPVLAQRQGDEVVVADAGAPGLDLEALRAFGRRAFGLGPWLGEDLSLGLCRQFLHGLVLDDPAAVEAVRGRGVLFLGNHQVQVESMIFPMVTTCALGRHIVTIAKEEHRAGWVGPLSSFTYRYPGVDYPRVIIYFDQSKPASMLGILEQLRRELTDGGHSVFVHVEGELGRACRHPVQRLSSVFIDLALELDLPIVPVRLAGGLPVQPLDAPLDFPLGYTRQTYHLGRPLLPAELEPLPLAGRRDCLLRALNSVGPPLEEEQPGPADPGFAARVQELRDGRGLDQVRAVVWTILERTPRPSAQTEELVQALRAGSTDGFADDERGRWLASAARWVLGEWP